MPAPPPAAVAPPPAAAPPPASVTAPLQWSPPPLGDDGWDVATDPAPPGFGRRNAVALVACAVAVVAVVIAVVALISSGDTSSPATASAGLISPTSASAAPQSSNPQGAAPGSRNGGARAIRATIVSESGSSWTVRTARGQTVTVTITPQTQFGTVKAPAAQSDFATGDSVVISGSVDNGAATATRVAAARNPGAGTSPTAAPSATTSGT